MVSVDKMQKYLKIAVDIESQLYTLQVSKAAINKEVAKINSTKYYDDAECLLNEITYNQDTFKDYVKENYTGFFKKLFKLRLFNSKVLSLLTILFFVGFVPQMVAFFCGIIIAVFKVPVSSLLLGVVAAVSLVLFVVFFETVHKIVNTSMLKKEFNQERFRHNKLCEQSNRLYEKNQLLLNGYEVQSNALDEELRETNLLRNKFYSEGILPPQYQNLVAVSTMYPWLKYKICTEVYGHGGLFDRYEYDLKLGAIIGNLQQINAKMDVVMQNQRVLIQEVRRGNEIAGDILMHVKSMEQTQSRMASDISEIKTSSRITAMSTARSAVLNEYAYWGY